MSSVLNHRRNRRQTNPIMCPCRLCHCLPSASCHNVALTNLEASAGPAAPEPGPAEPELAEPAAPSGPAVQARHQMTFYMMGFSDALQTQRTAFLNRVLLNWSRRGPQICTSPHEMCNFAGLATNKGEGNDAEDDKAANTFQALKSSLVTCVRACQRGSSMTLTSMPR